LIELGADVNHQLSNGDTVLTAVARVAVTDDPFMLLIKHGAPLLPLVLLESRTESETGADIHATNSDGKRFTQLFSKTEGYFSFYCRETLAFLREHGYEMKNAFPSIW